MASEQDLVNALSRDLSRSKRRLEHYDRYYEGEQPLKYMAPALQAELGDRITQLVLNWARMGADAYEHRLDVEGFRYPDGDGSADEGLWQLWQANDGDEQWQEGVLESLICGRAFAIVGAGDADDDPPVITLEHPLQVAVRRDPRTRRVVAALKRWVDEDGKTPRATLYLPDVTMWFVKARGGWDEDERDGHELGAVPVVPLVNRGRMLRPDGVSEFHDVIPVADAANKMATDMMISGEFHAMPRRWVFGMTEADFVDEAGEPLSTWSVIAGRLWATDKKKGDVEVGQFHEASLENFHGTIRLLGQLAAQILALPAHEMAFATDNPASADAIRSSEARLVKRCERKQVPLGGAAEQVMRVALRIMTGKWDPRARSLETIWRDPSTPTVAQKADAAVKLRAARITSLRQAREDLGYTAVQIARMEQDDEAEARRSLAGLADFGAKPEPAPAA